LIFFGASEARDVQIRKSQKNNYPKCQQKFLRAKTGAKKFKPVSGEGMVGFKKPVTHLQDTLG